jgi:GT2 family glycosyltransferase/SAM-dependent methyltransferase
VVEQSPLPARKRCLPRPGDGGLVSEGLHRYRFAADVCTGKRVLDLGCGDGYGVAMLAERAARVVGLDIDGRCIERCRRRYKGDELEFLLGTGLDMHALDSHSFDAVVCFEVIEYLAEHGLLLDEIRRVLRPDGLLLLSTPERRVHTDILGREHQYHVKQLSRQEILSLLEERFGHALILAHRAISGFGVAALNGISDTETSLYPVRREDGEWRLSANDSVCLLAVASDSEDSGTLAASILANQQEELIHTLNQRRAAASKRAESAETRARVALEEAARVTSERDEMERLLAHKRSSVRHLSGRVADLEEALGAWSASAVTLLGTLQGIVQDQHRVAEEERRRADELERALAETVMRQRDGVLRRAVRLGGRAQVSAPAPAPVVDDALAVLPAPAFPWVAEPEVSIVIPVHDAVEHTAACLSAIRSTLGAVSFEVILADDASAGRTSEYLARVDGARVLGNTVRRGFVETVNDAVEETRGRFVVLLNNDTEPQPGWLDRLYDTAVRDSSIGIVGPKLIFPDGRLQCAGGVVFADGSVANYGRYDSPARPEFGYVREVDYVPGSCLFIRREILTRLGGLDRAFRPAYYDDVDLAFAARSLAYRVVYQPASVVVHAEGASYGAEAEGGASSLQSLNRHRFAEKWKRELREQHPPGTDHLVRARDRRSGPRILVVDHQVPSPDRDAGSARMRVLLELLQRLGCCVSFVPYDGFGTQPYTEQLEQLGIEVLHGEIDLKRHVALLQPELCILSRPDPAWQLVRTVRQAAPRAKVIYDTVDLHFLREERRAGVDLDEGAARLSAAMKEVELALVRASEGAIAVSEPEADILASEVPGRPVYVVPLVYRERPLGPMFHRRENLLFVGGFRHPPNVDAVQFLADEVMPRVRRSLPRVQLLIAGGDVSPELERLAGESISFLGWVPDLAPLYRHVRLVLAPLRYGAGMKGKIIESLSFGVPVLTTSVGAEGIGIEHGVHALVSDGPDGFADLVTDAYGDAELWGDISAAGRRLFEDRYSPAAVESLIRDLLEDQGVESAF